MDKSTVIMAFEEILKKFQREKETGRIIVIADMSQGTIAKARTRQEKAIKS